MVDPHVRDNVEKSNRLPAHVERAPVESAAGESQAEVGEGDEDGLAGAKHGRGGLEVADAQPAPVVTLQTGLSSRGVDQEVSLPSGQLVEDEFDGLDDGRVLDHLGVQVEVGEAAGGALVNGLGDKGHVLLHVAGEVVVAVVAVLPAEVGHEQGRVHDPAHDIVELAVHGKGAVAALVGQDPDAGADEALDVAIDHPGGGAQPRVLDLGDVGEGKVAQAESLGVVTHHVGHGDEHRGLEAVLGNPAPDGLDIGELLLGCVELDGGDLRRGLCYERWCQQIIVDFPIFILGPLFSPQYG